MCLELISGVGYGRDVLGETDAIDLFIMTSKTGKIIRNVSRSRAGHISGNNNLHCEFR
jgi:hypothetical protein